MKKLIVLFLLVASPTYADSNLNISPNQLNTGLTAAGATLGSYVIFRSLNGKRDNLVNILAATFVGTAAAFVQSGSNPKNQGAAVGGSFVAGFALSVANF
jgi:hypothetical protein